MPSVRQPTIRARCSVLSLFAILTIMPVSACPVKHGGQYGVITREPSATRA